MHPVTEPALDRSYRALLAVPSLGRILLGMQIARIGQAMIGVALVLFTLSTYRSPALAGFVTFASIFPGLLVSPIAGALLDRHGRTRLIVLDLLVALGSLVLIGGLSVAGLLPAWLLVLIAAVSSLTALLSATGLRSLFPLIVPRHLWERVNAVDSNGYVVATILGPPLAAVLVQVWGGPPALVVIGLLFGIAALVFLRAPDPRTETASSGRLLVDAWQGLVYAWRNRTIRGIGVSLSVLNLAGGMTTIVIPLIILDRLRLDAALVGLVFAVQGLTGVVSGFLAGRIDTRGRERPMIVLPMFAMTGGVLLALPALGAEPGVGLLFLVLAMAWTGIVNGPLDIALFTVRQRRTDPAWMGRAFAISMSFNYSGFPIGSALTGWLVGHSLDLAIIFGALACVAASLLALWLVPGEDEAGPEPELLADARAGSSGS